MCIGICIEPLLVYLTVYLIYYTHTCTVLYSVYIAYVRSTGSPFSATASPQQGRRKSLSLRRQSSPGGLMTPARWTAAPGTGKAGSGQPRTGPTVNLDDVGEMEALLQEALIGNSGGGGGHNSDLPTTKNNNEYNSDTLAPVSAYGANEGNTIRPIDLSQFKEKLLSKINLSQSLPLLPSVHSKLNNATNNNDTNNNTNNKSMSVSLSPVNGGKAGGGVGPGINKKALARVK